MWPVSRMTEYREDRYVEGGSGVCVCVCNCTSLFGRYVCTRRVPCPPLLLYSVTPYFSAPRPRCLRCHPARLAPAPPPAPASEDTSPSSATDRRTPVLRSREAERPYALQLPGLAWATAQASAPSQPPEVQRHPRWCPGSTRGLDTRPRHFTPARRPMSHMHPGS